MYFFKMPTAAPDTCEPDSMATPAATETQAPTTPNSFYNTAPCLPPYTAYDLQVISISFAPADISCMVEQICLDEALITASKQLLEAI